MHCRVLRLAVAAVVGLGAGNLLAQGAAGTVVGSVADAQAGVLQGARVTLEPGGYVAATNADGKFSIAGVPDGTYTLLARYSGFDDRTSQIVVLNGRANVTNIVLSIGSAKDDVQVYAGREGGEVEAINRVFNAPNIINVLPAEVIISLPNANVADAMGRLPGVTLERDEGEGKYVKVRGTEPRLNHVTLDGVTVASPETVRQIKLDIIPANLVESVQVNKTLDANMEGSGIGGSVDLRTKSAQDRPTIYLDSTGGYTPIVGGRPVYGFDGTLGKRFFNSKFGALVSASYDFNGRGINDVESGPALVGSVDLRDYVYSRHRFGVGGTLDYQQSGTSNFYFKYLYSRFHDIRDGWIYSPAINSFADPTTLTQGGTDGTTSFQAFRNQPIQDVGGLQLGGHHVVRRALFSWNVNASLGRTRSTGYSTSHFAPIDSSNPLNNIQYNLNLNNPLEPHLDVQNGVDIFDTSKYFLQYRQVVSYNLPEVDLGFGGSVSLPYSLAGHPSTFEFGGLFRNEHKFNDQNTRRYYPGPVSTAGGSAVYVEDASLALSNFIGGFTDPNYYSGRYTFGPTASADALANFPGQTDRGIGDVVGNTFNQKEKISSGYLMNSTSVGRYQIVAGLRIEATRENNLGYLGATNSSQVTTTAILAKGSYINLLPSGSVRYAFTPNSAVRLVYSRGLSRPNFSDLIPYQSTPSGGNVRNTVTQGNPNLKAEYADSFDLLYERTLAHRGLLQGGVYYKHFSDPLVATTTVTAPYLVTQTINAGSAWVYGIEVAFQQHFTYLPGLLSGLGLSANYGYTASQAHLPPYVDTDSAPVGTVSGPNRGPEGANPALIGQAPNCFNLSPTYDKGNLSVRLGASYNQANIFAYQYDTSNNGPIVQTGAGGGPTGPNGDQSLYTHLQIDLQGEYKLPKGLSVVAYGLNLNNEVWGFYNGSPMYPTQREYYRQTFGGALRWSPHREQ